MSKQHNQITEQQAIDRQAAEWLTMMQSNTPDQSKLQAFDTWLESSAAHREAYLEAELLSDDLATLGGSEYAADIRATQQANDNTEGKRQPKVRMVEWLSKQWQTLFPAGYGLTAGVAVLAVTALSIWMLVPKVSDDSVLSGPEYRAVAERGENRTVQLADGSRVVLGPESEIVFRTDAEQRRLVLQRGDAFFDIAENSDRPFFVYAGSVAVKVVGTRFDVRRQPSGTSVSVVEGIVQVFEPVAGSAETPITLTKGQRASAKSNSELFHLDVEQNIASTELASWRQGRLVYRSAQLQDILADANRYSKNGQLSLANEQLLSEQVTLSLSVDELQDLPQMLAQLLPIKVERFMDDTVLVEVSE